MVRDGYIYGLSLLAVACCVGWATGSWLWGIPALLLAAFFLWFFRDPQRNIPAGAGLDCFAGRWPGDGDRHDFDTQTGRGSASASFSMCLMFM